MKAMRLLTVFLFALALIAAPMWAADAKKPCCEAKALAAQKDCACACCKKAAQKGEWCKKCHPQAKEEKKK